MYLPIWHKRENYIPLFDDMLQTFARTSMSLVIDVVSFETDLAVGAKKPIV